ncbi:type II toxin-antitoxin system VapC family toxin [Sphingopyxis indica]|uniref:PIN domain nuclease, a component of toxin-antitoxin system (PIN domain) n=1 Tax=Sphingopyxis indica TaxID=436663 RepID=A0A239EF92_9SPHN|nr:type II toxin-antitoxin system VapC family toxin [Sphingopyxis indica]WOF41758.1 type II toxin-antitoxin system VapC family toxin [Sphingopyxis indica]SNS43430.1 PIN domain nuclease, a component of toxin-antitoxin system (PIN domain) [Sphingopyxis indica]
MRLLLDTHVLLWWLGDNPRLGPEARGRFQRGDDELYASIASLWEIAIKNRTGKIDATASLIAAHLADCAIPVLPVELAHLTLLEQLPLIHRDPFDRMVVAQALALSATVITDDAMIGAYGIPCIAAGK